MSNIYFMLILLLETEEKIATTTFIFKESKSGKGIHSVY